MVKNQRIALADKLKVIRKLLILTVVCNKVTLNLKDRVLSIHSQVRFTILKFIDNQNT